MLPPTWPPNHGSMSVFQSVLPVARLADELVERLGQLDRERGLVVEARERLHERRDLGRLVAGQVETRLAVHDGVGGRPGEDGGGARGAREEERRAGRDGGDDDREDARRRASGRRCGERPACVRSTGRLATGCASSAGANATGAGGADGPPAGGAGGTGAVASSAAGVDGVGCGAAAGGSYGDVGSWSVIGTPFA